MLPYWIFLIIVFIGSSLQASQLISNLIKRGIYFSRVPVHEQVIGQALPLSKLPLFYVMLPLLTIAKTILIYKLNDHYYYQIPFSDIISMGLVLISHRWPFIDKSQSAPRTLFFIVATCLAFSGWFLVISFTLIAGILMLLLNTYLVSVPFSLVICVLGLWSSSGQISLFNTCITLMVILVYASEIWAFLNGKKLSLLRAFKTRNASRTVR